MNHQEFRNSLGVLIIYFDCVLRHVNKAFKRVVGSFAKGLRPIEPKLGNCKTWKKEAVQECEHGSCPLDTSRVQVTANFKFGFYLLLVQFQ